MSDLTGEQLEWLWRTKKSPRNVPPEVVQTLIEAGLLSRDHVGTVSLTPSGVACLENPQPIRQADGLPVPEGGRRY